MDFIYISIIMLNLVLNFIIGVTFMYVWDKNIIVSFLILGIFNIVFNITLFMLYKLVLLVKFKSINKKQNYLDSDVALQVCTNMYKDTYPDMINVEFKKRLLLIPFIGYIMLLNSWSLTFTLFKFVDLIVEDEGIPTAQGLKLIDRILLKTLNTINYEKKSELLEIRKKLLNGTSTSPVAIIATQNYLNSILSIDISSDITPEIHEAITQTTDAYFNYLETGLSNMKDEVVGGLNKISSVFDNMSKNITES